MPAQDSDVLFATAVKQQREAQGWSQAELAEKVTPYGLTFVATTIYKIETNKRKVSVAEAIALAHALRVSIYELVNEGTDSAFVTKEVLLDYGMQTLIDHERVVDSLHMIIERQQKMNKVIVDYRERHGEDPLWLSYLPASQNLREQWQPLIEWTGPADYLASWKALLSQSGIDYLSDLGWADDRTLPPSNG